ncbi:single-stranded DNA-binding protein [Verrucomicrobia bacterium LW23]|nr:single-stranded DNA-binding protein [Verrucomicrobia bacterium LW23]
MPDLNKVMLMGNLTRDPEVRYTPKGTAVGELGIAINSSYRSQDGTNREEVCYVDIEVWDRQAETCRDYLRRGSPVFIEGRLKLDQWETKEGEKKSRLRVRAERVQFLSNRSGGGGQPPSEGGGGGGGSSSGGGGGGGYSQRAREDYPREARREERSTERPPRQERPPAPPQQDDADEGDIPF